MKYKKQDDEREVIRSSIRDKVTCSVLNHFAIFIYVQYQLEKPVNDEDYEDEDEDDEGGAKKVEEIEEDPLEGEQLNQLTIINKIKVCQIFD